MKRLPPTKLHHSLMSRLKLRHLSLLEHLGTERHLTHIAIELGLSQPAVTKSLKEVEEIFMTRLFERTVHGLRPTAAGRVVLDYARLALADVESTTRVLAAIESGLSSRLRIGIIPDVPEPLLRSLLAHLTDQEQRIAMVVREGSTQDLMADLAARDLDCVIGRSHSHNDQIVQQSVLHQAPCLVVAAKSHRRLEKANLDLQKLSEMNWIMQPTGSTGRQTVESIFVAAGIDVPTPILETHSLQTIATLLRSDPHAVCIISRDVALTMVAGGAGAILSFAVTWDLPPISFFTSKDGARQKLIQNLGAVLRAAGQSLQATRP